MSVSEKKQTITGIVDSKNMNKTVVILIADKKPDKLYGKYTVRTRKIFAHDENNRCQKGNTVVIQSCRPISKKKSWMVVDVLSV